MALQDRIDELVRQSLWFDRLRAMGMIGCSGKMANAEASRRNNKIKALQKSLAVDSTTLYKLKQQAKENGELY